MSKTFIAIIATLIIADIILAAHIIVLGIHTLAESPLFASLQFAYALLLLTAAYGFYLMIRDTHRQHKREQLLQEQYELREKQRQYERQQQRQRYEQQPEAQQQPEAEQRQCEEPRHKPQRLKPRTHRRHPRQGTR